MKPDSICSSRTLELPLVGESVELNLDASMVGIRDCLRMDYSPTSAGTIEILVSIKSLTYRLFFAAAVLVDLPGAA